MIWIVVLVVLTAASLFAAHRALEGVTAFRLVAAGGVIPRGLVYAAGVVVGAGLSTLAIGIDNVLNLDGGGGRTSEKLQGVAQMTGDQIATIAWQAGLLVGVAFLAALALRSVASGGAPATD